MIKTILLIDDDISISEALRIFFRDKGYKIKSYPNGSDIDLKIKKNNPDLLLIDYLLPGKNGAEITKQIRRKKNAKNLPIIMIAADKFYQQEAKEAGVNEFIDKPFNLFELLKLVNHYSGIDRE